MSKERIDLAERLASMPASEAIRGPQDWATIMAALRASAVAEPEPHDPSQYCCLDACKREGCTRLAHMCLSKQPHPAPAAPVPASVREALEKIAKMCRPHASSEQFDGAILTIAEAALASLPAPEAAPTRDGGAS